MIEKLPESYVSMIREAHGEAGEQWLFSLEERIRTCEQRWSMRVLDPYSLSYNYVAPSVLSDGSSAVFKLGLPGGEIQTELEALRLHAGQGVRVGLLP